MKANFSTITVCLWIVLSLFSCGKKESGSESIQEYLDRVYGSARIPGMSVVVVTGTKKAIYNYGYSNLAGKEKVANTTIFELGSCSKAFTALAVYRLAEGGAICVDSPVSAYIPGFNVKYKGKAASITLRQLLNQSSGIPWNTIAGIPATDQRDALEETVKGVLGIELKRAPGREFGYATINYDILALVIEKVTGRPFEKYFQQAVLAPLHLEHTSMGFPVDGSALSRGYKIGFFKPIEYKAPVYRGNYAAGYVLSDASDMGQWLRYQMGIDSSVLSSAIELSHRRDESVAPADNKWYASGWFASLNGDNLLFHGGINPNFTSFVGFDPKQKCGVAVLANSNSPYTEIIGRNILRLLAGKGVANDLVADENTDRAFSTISILLFIYILAAAGFTGYIFWGIYRKSRMKKGMNGVGIREMLIFLVGIAPFVYGIYLLPKALAGFTWEAIWVWAPFSLPVLIALASGALAITYIAYFLSLYFPDTDRLRGGLPRLIVVSALAGVANMLLILLVTSALNSDVALKFQIFYFVLVLSVYLFGRRFVQVRLIKLTRDLIYDLRIKLIDRIFSTSYQKFEKIDRGRIYTALNDDVGTIGESINMFILLVTHLFTAAAAMIYLATIAFWATILTTLLILSLTAIYYFVSRSTNHYFEEARDTRNGFMRLLNGMIDGFKEISLRQNKKLSYKEDISENADEYRQKISIASIRYVMASLVGEIVLVSILGTAVFVFPRLFPAIQPAAISMFVIVLLYLINPVNGILQSIPAIKRLTIAWNRVHRFTKEIPANCAPGGRTGTQFAGNIHSLRVENLGFAYGEGDTRFVVGPIDLEVRQGEILFIIGGNGSGKTTLAKLLTGLYEADSGKIYIDEEEVPFSTLGERFSAVFNPHYLFDKLYDIDISTKQAEIGRYLDLLHLSEKVTVLDNGTFSTLDLSGGQRKRLALLLCYLEDSPIYLFDEWAADQDPEYRKFFYRTLLPEMAAKGKIIIAITHDDHYFDVADKVVKMNQGKLTEYTVREGALPVLSH